MSDCKVYRCGGRSEHNGLCLMHNEKAYVGFKKLPRAGTRHGAPLRFALMAANAHLDKMECLYWPFARREDGYGVVRLTGNTTTTAHRFVLHLLRPCPGRNWKVVHLCDNGRSGCVNPWHLRWQRPAGEE